MLHRFAKFVAGCTVLLVLAGSLVTSTGSGLSVPDWPSTYGWNMFTFPPSKWVGGILYEHGHRLIASSVGFLTIVLAVWLWLSEPRRWMRWLGDGARRPGRDLFLHYGGDRAVHVARLDRWRRFFQGPHRRRHHVSYSRDGDN